MSAAEFVVLGALGLAAVSIIAASNRKRSGGLPLSERMVLTMLRLAAWLERVATAWDAAIVRYRMERKLTVIEMESTRERVGAC